MQESVRYQYLAVLTVNIVVMASGVGLSWTSPSLEILKSDNSPLPSGRITTEEASWVASLWSLGGLIGNFMYLFITNKFGRKMPIISLAFPKIACWLLVLFAQNVYYLYASRLLYGIVLGGAFVVVPLFIREISIDRVRGALGSTIILSFNLGVLLGFILGDNYITIPIFIIVLMVIYAVLCSFFPESPTIFVKRNKIKNAEKSIKFYQNLQDENVEKVQLEINKLEDSLCRTDKCEGNSFVWSAIVKNPGKKSLIIGIVLASLIQLCGYSTIVSYVGQIFQEAGSAMSIKSSSIIVGVLLLVGSLVATFLVERAGRRFLYIVSAIGTTLALGALGTYTMLKSWNYNVESFNWVSIGSISLHAFISSWALLNLPFVVISEVLPENLKNLGQSLCLAFKWIFGFVIAKFFPLVSDLIGLHGAIFIFAICCALAAIFVIIFLPETKGKSYEQIMEMLR